MRFLRFTLTCLLALSTSCLLACSPAAGPSGKFKLAFVTNNAANFWTIARKGFEQADLELDNIELEFKIPSDGTAAEQRRIIDDLLAKGVSGIAISPVDPSNQTQMLNELAK